MMSACTGCGFWEPDCEACTCPSWDMWYACPIESERPENKKAMDDYIKQCKERELKNKEEWSTKFDVKIKEISTQINEQHDEILLKEIVECCNQCDLFEYKISVDMLKEALNLYFKKHNREEL